jgi:hypothetical protein
MPRDGSMILSDVRGPTLTIVCEPCGRRFQYNVERLMAEHGDAKLTVLLQTLADCPKAHSASMHDRCKAVYEGSWLASADAAAILDPALASAGGLSAHRGTYTSVLS